MAVELDATAKPMTSTFADLRRLFAHFSSRRRRSFVWLIVLMIACAIAEVATLGALMPFLMVLGDPSGASGHSRMSGLLRSMGLAGSGSHQAIVWFSIIFAGFAVVTGVMRIILTWWMQSASYGAGHDLSCLLFHRLITQPYSFHTKQNTADVVGLIHKVDLVIYDVLVQVTQSIASLVIAIFILVALLVIDPGTALAAGFGFALAYGLLSLSLRRMLFREGEILSATYGDRVRVAQESLGGIRDVIVDGSYGFFTRRAEEVDARLRRAQIKISFAGMAPRFVLESFGMALIAFLVLFMSRRDGGLAAALPILAALALGAQRLLPTLQLIYNSWARVEGTRSSLGQLLTALDLPEFEPPRLVQALPFSQRLELQDVSVRYSPDGPNALSGISLTIRKGERIGIVGPTGSGKSTLIDVILGLLKPNQGVVRVDDTRLEDDLMPAWRARVAHVAQSVYLADTTIACNIAFGTVSSEIDMARVRDAARRARIADHVESMPEGYSTVIGERGVRLSGGQRQRLGIARALYKKADILVLDEATSALDDATQTEVMRGLEELGHDVTMIMIAHRLTTLDICDRILRLERGIIVEERNISTRSLTLSDL